jgi:hypothetical protein
MNGIVLVAGAIGAVDGGMAVWLASRGASKAPRTPSASDRAWVAGQLAGG